MCSLWCCFCCQFEYGCDVVVSSLRRVVFLELVTFEGVRVVYWPSLSTIFVWFRSRLDYLVFFVSIVLCREKHLRFSSVVSQVCDSYCNPKNYNLYGKQRRDTNVQLMMFDDSISLSSIIVSQPD